MLRLLLFAIIMLALSGICNGQGVSNFGATRAQDTSKTKGQLVLPAYAGDSLVLITLGNGTVKGVSKNDISAQTPTLDAVTDAGNTTTNAIVIGQSTIQTDSIGKLLLYQIANVDSADIFGVVEGRASLRDVNTALGRMEFIKLSDDSTRNSEIRFSVGDDATMPVVFSIGNDSITGYRNMTIDGYLRVDTMRSYSHLYGQGAYLGTTPTIGSLTSTLFRVGIEESNGTTVRNGGILSVETGYTGAAALRLQNGLSISNVISSTNTSNWTQASSGHPDVRGVSSIISTESGATGITDYGSNYYGTMSGVVGHSWNKYAIFNGGYASNAVVNYAAGLHLSDFKVGITSRVGIHLDGNNETTGPAGSWGIYIDPTVTSAYNNAFGTGESYFGGYTDLGAYQLQVTGDEVTTGLDNYASNINGSFTSLSKASKGYVDSVDVLKLNKSDSTGSNGYFTQYDALSLASSATAPITLVNGVVAMPAAAAGVSGYINTTTQQWDGNKTNNGTLVVTNSSGSPFAVTTSTASPATTTFTASNSASQMSFCVVNDRGATFNSYGGMIIGGSTNAGTNLFGLSRQDRVIVFSDGSSNNGLAIGTLSNDPVTIGSNNTARMTIKATGVINISGLSTYADNAAALAGGLVAGDIYRTSTGVMMIVF